MIDFIKEFIEFIKERKLLMILPIVLILLLIGILLYITSSTAISPFIYTLF